MNCENYKDKHENFVRQKCIHQLFRPSMQLPGYIRPEGMGDCATCKPCIRNLECKGYVPVSLVPVYVEE